MRGIRGLSRPSRRPAPPLVVVVGGGFAGLTLVRALARQPVRVLLVDRHNYHLFTPLLYQVASALLNPSEIAQPIRKLVRGLRNCSFRVAEVQDIDLDKRMVRTDRGDITYDFLVVAAGSVNNYFGNPTIEEHSLSLKDLPDAIGLRNWILRRFEASVWERNPERRRQLLTFAVVGGGPTGVEFAGALMELIRLLRRRDFRRVAGIDPRVVLVEATQYLLPGFAPRLQAAARLDLERKGVEVRLGAAVRQLTPGRLVTEAGPSISTASVIWTAGVRGSPLGERLGLPVDRGGRVPVEPTLQLRGRPEVMVIGDLASLEELPMLAQVAIQQARLAAENIGNSLAGQPPQPFRYHDLGIMATIGRNAGVAQIGPLRLTGFAGWLLWLVVHLANIVTFRARVATLINWAWDYVAFDRPIRLMLRTPPENEWSRVDASQAQ